ncbi:hypothetical protein J6590_013838 [Homalodisca vitripennis]|nr:hypothetical protein J6590_013838 [Homalodisca vitripennis]
MFARFNSVAVTDGSAVHEHNTRARVNLRQTPHQTVWAASLPHNVGARCFWRLPEPLKCIQNKEEFKRKLKEHLVAGCFYTQRFPKTATRGLRVQPAGLQEGLPDTDTDVPEDKPYCPTQKGSFEPPLSHCCTRVPHTCYKGRFTMRMARHDPRVPAIRFR